MVVEDRDQTCQVWDAYQATHGDIGRANPRWPGINLEIESGLARAGMTANIARPLLHARLQLI